MPVPQSFNKILLTTSNNSEYNITLQEISGQLYINNHLVVTSANIGSLSNITTIESDVTTLQSDVTTIESDVTTLQSDVTTLQSDVASLTNLTISTIDTESNIRAIANAVIGDLAYGSDTYDFYVYDGTDWQIYQNI
jgi:prophage DNA circulation protein